MKRQTSGGAYIVWLTRSLGFRNGLARPFDLELLFARHRRTGSPVSREQNLARSWADAGDYLRRAMEETAEDTQSA